MNNADDSIGNEGDRVGIEWVGEGSASRGCPNREHQDRCDRARGGRSHERDAFTPSPRLWEIKDGWCRTPGNDETGAITTKQTHRGGTASYTWCFHDDCVIHLPGFKDPQRGSLLNVRQPASRPGPRAIESRSRASVDTCTITVLREDRRTGCSDPASIPSSRRVFAGGAWGRIDRRSGRRAVSGRRQVRGSSTEQRRAA